MHQYTHSHAELAAHDGLCPTCGQPWPEEKVLEYGSNKPSRWGMAFTVGLHLLVVLIYFIKPKDKIDLNPQAKQGEMVYINQAKQAQQPKPKAPVKPNKETPRSARAYLPPNKNAITEIIKPNERIVPPEQAKLTPPPENVPDMATLIKMRRRARNGGAEVPQLPTPEEEKAKALERARANIMGAQGRTADGKLIKGQGLITFTHKTFNTVDFTFRGYSSNSQRNSLRVFHVEQGSEKNVETAVAKKIIALMRERWGEDDISIESARTGRVSMQSTRKQDEKELQDYLMREFFPELDKLQ